MLIHKRKLFFWPYKHLYSFKLAMILSSSKKTKSHKEFPPTLAKKSGISVNYKSLYWPLWAYWEGSVNAYRDESGGVSWPTVRASCWSEKQKRARYCCCLTDAFLSRVYSDDSTFFCFQSLIDRVKYLFDKFGIILVTVVNVWTWLNVRWLHI